MRQTARSRVTGHASTCHRAPPRVPRITSLCLRCIVLCSAVLQHTWLCFDLLLYAIELLYHIVIPDITLHHNSLYPTLPYPTHGSHGTLPVLGASATWHRLARKRDADIGRHYLSSAT